MNEILSAGAYEPWVQDLVAPAQVVFVLVSVFVFVFFSTAGALVVITV